VFQEEDRLSSIFSARVFEIGFDDGDDDGAALDEDVLYLHVVVVVVVSTRSFRPVPFDEP
jgi:hypothetical protein